MKSWTGCVYGLLNSGSSLILLIYILNNFSVSAFTFWLVWKYRGLGTCRCIVHCASLFHRVYSLWILKSVRIKYKYAKLFTYIVLNSKFFQLFFLVFYENQTDFGRFDDFLKPINFCWNFHGNLQIVRKFIFLINYSLRLSANLIHHKKFIIHYFNFDLLLTCKKL